MTSVSQDVRYSLRMLLKHKGFTVLFVLTLALGIGLNTAMFSVLNTFLFGSLPYPQSKRLVTVWRTLSSTKRPRVLSGPTKGQQAQLPPASGARTITGVYFRAAAVSA